MKWIKIEEELQQNDFVKLIVAGGKKLCIVQRNGDIFAFQNTCPHAGGILSNGWCEDGNLVCPVHRYKYNLGTGRGVEGQGDYITKYPLEHRDDGLYIGIKESWISKLLGSK